MKGRRYADEAACVGVMEAGTSNRAAGGTARSDLASSEIAKVKLDSVEVHS